MPIPAWAAIVAPHALDFVTGLFGGKKRGESPEIGYNRIFNQYLKGMPKLDTRGIYSQAVSGYDQSARMGQEQRGKRFRQVLGPRAFSVAEATGGRDVADRAKFGYQTAADVRRLGFDAEMQRQQMAAGIAGSLFGPTTEYSQSRNLFDRSMALTASGARDYLEQQAMLKRLKQMGVFS